MCASREGTFFSADQVRTLEREGDEVWRELRNCPEGLLTGWLPRIGSPRAREYLTHGVCRRFRVIARCLENVFRVCPPRDQELLTSEQRADVEINLHAFVINVHGALDNLAWVTLLGGTPDQRPNPRTVSLFRAPVQQLLSAEAQRFLTDPKIVAWHIKYAKVYRDALAHRIPLYVPPAAWTTDDQRRHEELERQANETVATRDLERLEAIIAEQRQIGTLLPVFVHSYYDEDATAPLPFHPQLIADSRTMLEITRLVSP